MLKRNVQIRGTFFQKRDASPGRRFYRSVLDEVPPSLPPGGTILGLFASIQIAEKVAKAAKRCHLSSKNSDKASAFAEMIQGDAKIAMVLIDWDTCEVEAYKLLPMLRAAERLKKTLVLGFVSQSKSALIAEAQRAGCDRVLTKTEFLSELESIIARCSL
jgi:PleD family two-component response regulator